jgi:hypothetical protein
VPRVAHPITRLAGLLEVVSRERPGCGRTQQPGPRRAPMARATSPGENETKGILGPAPLLEHLNENDIWAGDLPGENLIALWCSRKDAPAFVGVASEALTDRLSV